MCSDNIYTPDHQPPVCYYQCMPKHFLTCDSFTIMPIQPEHIESVRKWRNDQTAVLRQSGRITQTQQKAYYEIHIWPDMQSPYPRNILLAFLQHDNLIGYGGLVHTAWEHGRAEISFLLDTRLAGSEEDHTCYFPTFLKLIQTLAFKHLRLTRLYTETYAVRPHYIAVLERSGFLREGILKQHVRVNAKPFDALVHGLVCTPEIWRPADRSFRFPGHILLTSASKKVPLIRVLQEAGRKIHSDVRVIAGDSSLNVLTRYIADDFWKMPRIDTHDNSILKELLEGCQARHIRTILPVRDGELVFWAENRHHFEEQGIKIIVASVSGVRLCLDKLAFAAFGVTNCFPIIPAWRHPDETASEYYVVKERFGSGSKGMGLKLNRSAALEFSRRLKEPIFQPFIEGTEISIDAWLNQTGKIKGIILRRRELVSEGESQVTSTFQNSRIERVFQEVLEKLNLQGPVVMQAIIDSSARLHIVECNARFGGASTLALAAGLDSLFWSLVEAHGGRVDSLPFERNINEIRQVRIPTDLQVVYDTDF